METKFCPKCEKHLEFDKFYYHPTKKKLNGWCKNCLYKSQKTRWKDRRRKAVQLLGGKCEKCGYNRNLAALEFHHVEPAKKEFNWNKLRGMRWKDIVRELKKCILLCSNCHKELHWPQWSNPHVSKLCDNVYLNAESLVKTGECPQCGCDVYGSKFCSVQCVSLFRRKTTRPKKRTLTNSLKTESWCAIGRKYGVSDNAVRKWARTYGLIA